MYIVGIAGGSGSGKTTIVNILKENLSERSVTVIPQDNYYRDLSHLSPAERSAVNVDHPDSLEFDLLVEQLQEFKKGVSVNIPTYSHADHTRLPETVVLNPCKVLIVEGILIFSHPALREIFDLKVFVDTDADERLRRRMKRDIEERGRDEADVIRQYRETVKPMHDQFIEPFKKNADLILPRGGENKLGIQVLLDFLLERS